MKCIIQKYTLQIHAKVYAYDEGNLQEVNIKRLEPSNYNCRIYLTCKQIQEM